MEQKPFVPKTATDFQKMRLEKLMANPDKPVLMPEPRKEKGLHVPEFVRNVMGSSAGAGSGEFHVYRHLRRKEYTRQKMIEAKAEQERLDEEFQQKLEESKRKMEEKMAKKRLKRLKRKEKMKIRKKVKPNTDSKKEDAPESTKSSSAESEDEISRLKPSNLENEQSTKPDESSQSVMKEDSNPPCEQSISEESSS